jgi:hypothetical protein
MSDCLWPNVADMQKCLMATLQEPFVMPPYKKKRTVALSLGYEVTIVDVVGLTDPSFSVSSVPVVGKKRKARM